MKMKQYQNPEMEVIKLNNKTALLAGSGSGEVIDGCLTKCEDED